MANTMQTLLTVNDIAEALHVSPRKAHDLVHQMPHYSVGGTVHQRIVVSQADFDAWLQSRRCVPAQPVPITAAPRARKYRSPALSADLFEPDGRVKRRRA